MYWGVNKVNKTSLAGRIISLVFLLLAISLCTNFSSPAFAEDLTKPEQIILTWTSDPATSQTITWLMSNDSPAKVQYIKANEFSGSFDSAQSVGAIGSVFDSVYYRYTVNLTGLNPDTKYVYRVGSDEVFSDTLSFTTAADTDSFTFLYMGDVQAGYAEWGEMLNHIINTDPSIKFSLLGGDLTDKGNDPDEWSQFLDAAKNMFAHIPVMPTLGNHDGYMYLKFFVLPTNGPAGLQQEFYSFDYGNAHFAVLNSNNNTNEVAKQWLREDLQNTTKKWKFVVFHHPAYQAFDDNKTIDDSIRANWIPILEQYGVDMVFVGHQHLYMRTHPIYQGEVQTDSEAYGIVYVMGNAGSKFYTGGQDYPYIAMEETGSNYQIININGDKLVLTAKKANGELIESYTLYKKGVPVKLTSPTPDKEFVAGEQVTIKGVAEKYWTSVEILVTDPDGNTVYGPIDVGIVGGNFETSFMLNSSAKVGTYTIIIVGEGLPSAITSTFIVRENGEEEPSDDIVLTIAGDGIDNKLELTLSELQEMEPYYHEYSTINTWPTKHLYLAEGVRLSELLLKAGINDDAKLITFVARDGFTKTLTREQLEAPRYYYPSFKENHEYFGYIAGSPEGAQKVETILALRSVAGNYPDYMDGREAPLLVMGQRWLTEQTNELFVKNVRKINVSTKFPDKWESPSADVESAVVPAGTKVILSTSDMDGDNIHYTTDGSTPTIKSPIYNWIKKRWWPNRAKELEEINKPIEITKDTTIKAITIGAGKQDSDIVTFNYQVFLDAAPNLIADTTNNIVGEDIHLTFIDDPSWRAAIREISVDGLILDAENYLTDTPGVLTINRNVFSAAGEYTIKIKALGYDDVVIVQVMDAPVIITEPTSGQEFVQGAKVKIKGTVEDTVSNLTIKVTNSKGEVVYDVKNIDLVEGEFETSFTLSSNAETGIYTITIDGVSLAGKIIGTFLVKADGNIVKPIGDVVLTISGSGVNNEIQFTLDELKAMPQHRNVYSAINTWPTKKWYAGEGIKLKDLLNLAGLNTYSGLIRIYSADGFNVTLTMDELLNDKRYYYPRFKDGLSDADGHIPGSTSGAREVDTILGLLSVEGSDNYSYMNDLNSLLLMLGQRSVTEQTGQLFVKNVNRIEVINSYPSQWESPKVNIESGKVEAGTKIKFTNTPMDDDKIHYTIDGSNPTIHSPMYNWVASRWWSSRGEDMVNSINKPIELTKDTTIKAIRVGPGKRNSEIVTFNYQVTQPIVKVSEKLNPLQEHTIVLDNKVEVRIPANALQGNKEVEFIIDKVNSPPEIPEGRKLISSVYEFSIDGEKTYKFEKKITIKLSFDDKDVTEEETIAIHYYNEDLEKWINLGGVIEDNFISVEVDHFTKFAVLAVEKDKLEELEEIKQPEVNLNDIKNHWAKKYIEKLVINGAVSGYPDGTFRPDNNITRAEFITMLVKAFKLESQDKKIFIDTKEHWANNFISIAASHEIVSGYEDNTFRPDNLITREEMAVMVAKAIKLRLDSEESKFMDSDVLSSWARPYVSTVVNHGIIQGYPNKTFQPQKNATRAEAVTIIVRALELDN